MNAYRNDYDWFVAENMEDLEDLFVKLYGEGDWDAEEWQELDPESPLTVSYYTFEECPSQALIEHEGDGKYYCTMRIKDWIGRNGKGLLCSTEE